MKEKLLLAFLVFLSSIPLSAQDIIIRENKEPGFFPVVSVAQSHGYLCGRKRSLANAQSG